MCVCVCVDEWMDELTNIAIIYKSKLIFIEHLYIVLSCLIKYSFLTFVFFFFGFFHLKIRTLVDLNAEGRSVTSWYCDFQFC